MIIPFIQWICKKAIPPPFPGRDLVQHAMISNWRIRVIKNKDIKEITSYKSKSIRGNKRQLAISRSRYAQCKMTIRYTTLTTFFLIAFSVLTYSQSADSLKAKRIIITTSVLEYLPTIKLNTGNFNIGTEIYLKNRKSVYANFGLIKSYGQPSGWFSLSSQGTQGLKIQVEGRHYFNRHKIFEPAILLFWPHIFQYKSQTLQNTGYYLALHSFYQWTATDRQETVVDYIDNNPFPNSTHYKQNIYLVDRNVYGLNIKFGYQCIKKCGLTVDYSVGLGGQYISSDSSNKLGTNNDKDLPWNKLFDSGTGFYPNIIYQVRLGWGL